MTLFLSNKYTVALSQTQRNYYFRKTSIVQSIIVTWKNRKQPFRVIFHEKKARLYRFSAPLDVVVHRISTCTPLPVLSTTPFLCSWFLGTHVLPHRCNLSPKMHPIHFHESTECRSNCRSHLHVHVISLLFINRACRVERTRPLPLFARIAGVNKLCFVGTLMENRIACLGIAYVYE